MPQADLCAFDLPSGKPCRQVTLKGEQVCRHHARNFRHIENKFLHDQAMERLAAKLSAVALPELLRRINRRLDRIQTVVRLYPDVQLALRIASDRLQRRIDAELAFETFARQNPMPDINSPEFNKLFETHMESMI